MMGVVRDSSIEKGVPMDQAKEEMMNGQQQIELRESRTGQSYNLCLIFLSIFCMNASLI